MVVAMRNAKNIECLAAVVGAIDAGIQDINGVGGFRIGENVRVVPSALAEPVIVGQQLPILPAIIVVAERMSESRNEGNIRIFRVYNQSADCMRVGKTNEFPGLAGVNRLKNSVAAYDVAADASFARTYINDVGIRFGNRERAN